MLIAIETIFICMTLFVLWMYILSEAYFRAHRLLPLIMGLIAVFQFNELVRLRFGFENIIIRIHDLVLMQICYICVCYFIDYLYIKLPKIVHAVFFCGLIYVDYIIFANSIDSDMYQESVIRFFVACVVMAIAILIYAFFNKTYSKQEKTTNIIVTTAISLPGLVSLYNHLVGNTDNLILIIALEISIITVFALAMRGYIIDTRGILNNNIFKDSEIAILFFDMDYYLITLNDKARQVFGKTDYNLEEIRRSRQEYKRFADYVRTHNDEDEEEIGSRFYCWKITDVHYRGKLRGFIVQLVDVTEQREEVKRMEALKTAAEEQSMLKARFLAVQSHELRSPLQAIIGISQILSSKKSLSSQDRRLASHINSSGNSLLTIVNSILDFSKLESGNFTLSNRPYQVLDTLMELAQISIVNLENKPIIFSIDIESTYPSVLIGDELCLKEMIQNLLSNAIKFTGEGEIRCKISFDDVPGGTMMTVIVKDTGMGMSKEAIDHVFEDYTSYASEKSKEGTGLGLSIVMQLAKRMQGGAWAESDGVSGSSVGFSIFQEIDGSAVTSPPMSIDQFAFKGPQKSTTLEVHPSYCFPTARVLIVDDMKINRKILRELTAPWRFFVDEAKDGEEALQMVKQREYDLIILDLRMPKMDGEEAAGEIRKLCNTPLVLMSANLFDATKDKYLLKGFDAVLSKPLDMKEVKMVLEGFLPDEKAVISQEYGESLSETKTFSSDEARYQTMATFMEELKDAGINIEKTYMMDPELFQTKVHGIKGAARQLGYDYVADKSEVMEMAAKAGHRTYIERFINEYADELLANVEDIKAELELLERQINAVEEIEPSIQKKYTFQEEVDGYFAELKEGFEKYDYDMIETAVRKLKGITLTESEQALFNAAVKAMNDFEYERGAALFKKPSVNT